MLAYATSKEADTGTQDYAAHAQRWEESGQSQQRYCTAQGLNYKKFVKYRQQLLSSRGQSKQRGVKAHRQFIPVYSTEPTPKEGAIKGNSPANTILLRLPQGSVVELPTTLKPIQLSTIFKSLGAVLC